MLYCVPVHGWHAVLSVFWPSPAWQVLQLAAFGPTTSSHSWHSKPNCEYVVPVQSTQPLMSSFGAFPGEQVMHPVAPSPSAFVTSGAWHGSHDGAPLPANLPTGHNAHSVCSRARVLPASHGMQKNRWSCLRAWPGPIVPAGHASHFDTEWRVSVV